MFLPSADCTQTQANLYRVVALRMSVPPREARSAVKAGRRDVDTISMSEQFGGGRPRAKSSSGVDDYFVTAPMRPAAPAPTRQSFLPSVPVPPVPSPLNLGGYPGAPRPRPDVKRLATPVVIVLAIVAALSLAHLRAHEAVAAGSGDGIFGTVTSHPPARDFVNPQRVLAAPAAVAGTGGYTVLHEQGGDPVTWDPCQPIHFVVRTEGAPPGGRLLLDQAMAEISKDTGLLFMDDGSTNEAPSADRNPYQPSRYGKSAWAPVLISWSNATEYPGLAGDVIGLAGPVALGGENAHLVSGQVVFDAPDITKVEGYSDGATFAYDVMLHELGHLVGLGHVEDPDSVMNPVSSRPLTAYSQGDLRGLAVLGSGRCLSRE